MLRVPTTKAADDIIDALRADIASKRLPLGSRLPTEVNLAAHYGVSKPTIREAVRALDAMGLVEVRHGSGAYVRGDSEFLVGTALQVLMQLEDVGIVEALDVRGVLGQRSAGWAATLRTPEDLELIEHAYAQLDSTVEMADYDELINAIAGFQEAVSAASHNALISTIESVLIRLLLQMQFKALRSRGLSFWQTRAREFQGDRLNILNAIKSGDAPLAQSEMTAYLDHQRELFISDPALAGLRLSDPKAMRVTAGMPVTRRGRA